MEWEHLEPLKKYLEARKLYTEGKKDEAAKAVAEAFGSYEENNFLRQNIDVILNEMEPAGSIVLDGVYGEAKWIQRKKAIPRKHKG